MKRLIYATAALVVAAGCSHHTAGDPHGPKIVFDEQKMAATIEHSPQGRAAGLHDLTCPASQQVKKGRQFDCTGVSNAGKVTIHIKVTSDSGDYLWSQAQ